MVRGLFVNQVSLVGGYGGNNPAGHTAGDSRILAL